MFRIGKLQSIDCGRLSLPCERWRLLEIARLTGHHRPAIKAWSAVIGGDPGLLIFSIDRFESLTGQPPAGMDSLATWARLHLAKCLTAPHVVKRLKKNKQSAAVQWLARWSDSRTSCQRSGVVFQLLKHQRRCSLKSKDGLSEIKRWVRDSAQPVLEGAKFKSLVRHATFASAAQGNVGGRESGGITPAMARSLLRLSTENLRLRSHFETRLEQEKLASLKQLAYGASHEINNPLANIATGAQALIQSEPDADRRRRLANIYQQSMAAHDMISDLMLFAHPPAPVFETVDLRTLVAEIMKRSAQQGRTVGATFGVDVNAATLDRNQMTIAIEALIRNAFEAIEQQSGAGREPEVSIRIDVAGEDLRIFVIDNGPGFSAEQGRHLFDPFYSGREAGRGLGFGLSKVYRIVHVHRGQIVADRDKRTGETTFMIRLPLKSDQRTKKIRKTEACGGL